MKKRISRFQSYSLQDVVFAYCCTIMYTYIVYIIIIIFGSNEKCGKLAINFNYKQ